MSERAAAPMPIVDPDVGAALIGAEGPATFGSSLLRAAQQLGRVEEVFAYRAAAGGRPQTLASSSERDDVEQRVEEYRRRFFDADPIRHARATTPAGSSFVRAVAASEIERRDYRSLCFDRPGFKEKLCFGWQSANDWWSVSFYRREADDTIAPLLGGLASFAISVLVQRAHAAGVGGESLAARLEHRLQLAHPGLTLRERQVCAGTIAGEPAAAIAKRLGISPASVLTYRQRAYRRTDVSAAGQLLDRVFW